MTDTLPGKFIFLSSRLRCSNGRRATRILTSSVLKCPLYLKIFLDSCSSRQGRLVAPIPTTNAVFQHLKQHYVSIQVHGLSRLNGMFGQWTHSHRKNNFPKHFLLLLAKVLLNHKQEILHPLPQTEPLNCPPLKALERTADGRAANNHCYCLVERKFRRNRKRSQCRGLAKNHG